MEMELNPEVGPNTQGPAQPQIDPSKIKQQFAEMNAQAAANQPQPQMTEAEMLARQKEEEDRLDKVLPYLRKQAEATKLEMDLTRMDVLIGRVNPASIPGAFGKQLEVEAMTAQLQWSQLKLDQQEMIRRAMAEKDELFKQQKAEADKQPVDGIPETPTSATTEQAEPNSITEQA